MERKRVLIEGDRSSPTSSPERVLIATFVRAHLRTVHLPRAERRAAFLREVESAFDMMAHAAAIPRLRTSEARLKEIQDEAEAMEWYRERYALLVG